MKNVLVMARCSEYNKERLMNHLHGSYNFYFEDQLEKEEQLQKILEKCQIIVGEPDYEQIKNLEGLEWVQMTWAGTDKYTKNGPFPENVILSNASGAFGVIISEYVIAGILALYRRFPYYMKKQQEKSWSPLDQEDTLFGKKILILGAGNIGTEVARRLNAFQCEIYGIRRKPAKNCDFHHMGDLSKLEEWLALADVIVSAIPNNKESMGLLSYEKMKLMKKKAIIVNVGRGHIFEENALERILEENRIYGAVLDVQRQEPLDRDHIFWKQENVIITPHIAGPSFSSTEDTQNRIYDIVMENLRRYEQGEELKNLAEF